MFEVGGTVLYGNEGVCTIKDITQKEIGDEKRQYYVLEPMYQRKSTVFVPTDNEKLARKMRRVITRDEVKQLIEDMPSQPLAWIEDDHKRKDYFKEVISRADCKELIRMSRTLYLRREEVVAKGRKLGVADDRFMKTAEKMINDEFATVLHIDPEQVPSFISERMESRKRRWR